MGDELLTCVLLSLKVIIKSFVFRSLKVLIIKDFRTNLFKVLKNNLFEKRKEKKKTKKAKDVRNRLLFDFSRSSIPDLLMGVTPFVTRSSCQQLGAKAQNN